MDAFDNIKVGASKADYFRALILYKHGGIYSDIDNKLKVRLTTLLSNDTEFMCAKCNDIYDCCILGCNPGNPVIKQYLDNIYENIKNKTEGTSFDVTGPTVLQNAIKSHDVKPTCIKMFDHFNDYYKIHKYDHQYVSWDKYKSIF